MNLPNKQKSKRQQSYSFSQTSVLQESANSRYNKIMIQERQFKKDKIIPAIPRMQIQLPHISLFSKFLQDRISRPQQRNRRELTYDRIISSNILEYDLYQNRFKKPNKQNNLCTSTID